MTMPFYVSPEQWTKDKAEYARKGIARGRTVVVLQYEDGIALVAPNPSRALHKISELYDRIGFAAVGSYREYEALRQAGVRYADVNGYRYDRSDVTARGLAIAYAQSLGAIFTESNKAYEVEIVVAEVGETSDEDQVYRLTFDGSVLDEHGFLAMGGRADEVAGRLKERYAEGMPLPRALDAAVTALKEPDGDPIPTNQLEVAVLDRTRSGRKFRRISGTRLERMLEEGRTAAEADRAPAQESGEEPGEGAGAESSGEPGGAPPTAPPPDAGQDTGD